MTSAPAWRPRLGVHKHTWGYGSSPVLHGDRVFLNCGPAERTFLIALDKKRGKTLWQVNAPRGQGTAFNRWTADDMFGSWTTPLVIRTPDVRRPRHRTRAVGPARA